MINNQLLNTIPFRHEMFNVAIPMSASPMGLATSINGGKTANPSTEMIPAVVEKFKWLVDRNLKFRCRRTELVIDVLPYKKKDVLIPDRNITDFSMEVRSRCVEYYGKGNVHLVYREPSFLYSQVALLEHLYSLGERRAHRIIEAHYHELSNARSAIEIEYLASKMKSADIYDHQWFSFRELFKKEINNYDLLNAINDTANFRNEKLHDLRRNNRHRNQYHH